MSTKLGRLVAFSLAGAALVFTGATVVGATGEPPPESTTPSTEPDAGVPEVVEPTTTTTTTSSTTTTSTTSTTMAPPLVIDLPPAASSRSITPDRGTQAQITDTLPPPPTTTTTTLPPPDALPANSGSGRRVVYSKSAQRVWTVESNGAVSKTHLVSGRRTWNQPLPGTYSVFSRSSYTCNIKNPALCWRYMVRFTKGPGGDNIGFHEIPTNNNTGNKVQSVSQLGTALSSGCVRQSTPDAQYMWGWAWIGTKVVVLP